MTFLACLVKVSSLCPDAGSSPFIFLIKMVSGEGEWLVERLCGLMDSGDALVTSGSFLAQQGNSCGPWPELKSGKE